MSTNSKVDHVDILMFAEDPGAANFLAPLDALIREAGWTCAVAAIGLAAEIFARRGIACIDAGGSDALTTLRPRLVLAGTASNPDSAGLQLISNARKNSVPTAAVIDAAMNPGLRFCGRTSNPLAHAPDWVLVPDEIIAASFVELGMPATRVLACGNPHYDYVMELGKRWRQEDRRAARQRMFPGVPDSAKILLFAAEGSARLMPAATAAAGSVQTQVPGRTESALKMLLDALAGFTPRPYVVLRAHPKDGAQDYAEFSREIGAPRKDGDALEMAFAADLIVGTTSMLMTEAALLGRPVIAIVPDPAERCWLPTVRLGLTPTAATPEQVVGLVQNALRSATGDRDLTALAPLQDSGTRAMQALKQIRAS